MTHWLLIEYCSCQGNKKILTDLIFANVKTCYLEKLRNKSNALNHRDVIISQSNQVPMGILQNIIIT